jgi:3D (Asp-Asp-Asp) domain-containing protein
VPAAAARGPLAAATATVSAAEAPAFRPTEPVPEGLVSPAALAECEAYVITGYVRGELGGWTYDGTPIWTDEPIVAASWNLPIDALVEIEGLGRFRVADRGHLGARHIDVAVWSRAEAFALTGVRNVCVVG